MKKIITVFALIVMFACSASDWQMKIIADMPVTKQGAIQFAIVEDDLKEKFVAEFNSGYLQEVLKTAKTDEEKNMQITTSVMVNWDLLFNDVPGDNLYLLNNKDTSYFRRTEGIFSHHSKKIWLASKAFIMDGKAYCYFLPFAVSNGSQVSCRLDQRNMISLTEVYQKQIKKGK